MLNRWQGKALAPCGTRAAYQRHLRHHEQPCTDCTQANRAFNAGQRAARTAHRAAVKAGLVLVDHREPDRRPVRNGLPAFRPYVYRGLGYDQLEARNA